MRADDGHQSEAATARLLWEACRRWVDVDRVRAAIADRADVGRAAVVATDQRLGPLLWRTLDQAGCLDDLGPSRSWMAPVVEACRVEAALLVPKATITALTPLLAAGLEPVVLKGPVVAARYPAPGLRPMDDLDVLLPPDQHAAADAALRDAGWRTARGSRPDLYDVVYTHDEVPSMALELHHSVEGTTYRVTRLDALALWERRIPAVVHGVDGFGLAPEDEVVFLCAHAGKPHHNFSRLIWIADLAMLTGWWRDQGTELDWSLVSRRAIDGGCAGVVAAALAMAGRAGAEVPSGLLPLPSGPTRRRTMRQLLDERYPLDVAALPGYRLQYALADTVGQRARILVTLLGSGHRLGTRGRAVRARLGGLSRRRGATSTS